MNTAPLIEKLKSKVNESNEFVEETYKKQKNLLSISKEFNLKLRNYIESDINEKNLFADANEKMTIIKTRMESAKQNVQYLREKIKNLKTKYDN
jgi:hypothetical protein